MCGLCFPLESIKNYLKIVVASFMGGSSGCEAPCFIVFRRKMFLLRLFDLISSFLLWFLCFSKFALNWINLYINSAYKKGSYFTFDTFNLLLINYLKKKTNFDFPFSPSRYPKTCAYIVGKFILYTFDILHKKM